MDRESPEKSKSCIYRYFFYNFLISAALPDIILLTRNDNHHYKLLHHEIFRALAHILVEMQDKQLNDTLDEEIIV
jgi:hypothetical protein